MECTNCGSHKVLEISAKCSDMCNLQYKGEETDGYVPSDLPIGDGDYLEFDICLDCGKVIGIENHPDPQFYTERRS